MGHGRRLEFFILDDRPCPATEAPSWAPHILLTPRNRIAAALAQPEAHYAGVYMLFGERVGEGVVRIGGCENIAARIENLEAKKHWWTNAIFVTARDNMLSAAQLGYLRRRIVEETEFDGQIKVEVAKGLVSPSLPEATQAEMEAFLRYVFPSLAGILNNFVQKTWLTPSRANLFIETRLDKI